NLSHRTGDVGGQPLDPGDVTADGQVDEEAAAETDQESNQHQHMKGQSAPGPGLHPVPAPCFSAPRLANGQSVDQPAWPRRPLGVQPTLKVQRRLSAQVPIEYLAVVAACGDGVLGPCPRQIKTGTEVAFVAQQAP